MRCLGLLALLGACSASPTTVYEPIPCPTPSSSVQQPSCPPCAEHKPCPAVEEKPAQPVPAPVDPWLQARTAKGWHCFEMRNRRTDSWFIGVCTRTARECKDDYDHSKALSTNKHMTACRSRSQAVCFRLTDPLEGYSLLKCYATLRQCLFKWGAWQDATPDRVKLSDCEHWD